MLKKIIILMMVVFFFSCSAEKNKNKRNETNKAEHEQQEIGEHKSIHQQEWEEHQTESRNYSLEKTDLEVIKTENITLDFSKKFILPHYTTDAKKLVFTTENYNGIWIYDFEKNIIRQLNALPGSGYKFELSSDGSKVYFRNKTFKKNNPKAEYAIIEQTIYSKKMNMLYISKNVLTPPVQIDNEIIFLENDKPKAYNIKTKKIEKEITSTFIYVVNNKLIKFTKDKKEIISLNGMKPISSKYTRDKKNIICLTAAKGLLLLDNNGTVLNIYPKAFSLSKLSNSNLVVFTEEEDNGKQIVKSDIYIGFTNSDKKIKLKNLEDKKIFNPVWSGKENKIAYNTEDGEIKIITLNIHTKEEKK